MSEWTDRLAGTFGLEPLSDEETERLLHVARDVAHRVERKETPLAAFLLGMDVASRVAGGASRDAAFAASIAAVESLLPAAPEDPPGVP